MTVLIDEKIISLHKKNEDNSGSSKAQRRVIQEEVEHEQQLAAIEQNVGAPEIFNESAQIISISSRSKAAVESIASIELAGNENSLSIESFIKLVESGVSENDILFYLETAISSLSANIGKNNLVAKKQLKNLLEMMQVFEQHLAKTQQNPELQASLRQMQSKLVGAARTGNIEQLQSLLKSPELKSTLQQSANLAAKQPESLASMAENLRANQSLAQRNAASQKLEQKPEQPQEQKANLMEKLLAKLAEKSNEIKDMLGLQSRQQQSQLQPMREDASRNQPKPQSLQSQNFNNKVIQFEPKQTQPTQNPAAYLRQTTQQAQITPIGRAEQTRPVSEPARESVKQELRAAEEPKKPADDKPITAKPTDDKKPDEPKKDNDKAPPTKGEPKEVGGCGKNDCRCPKTAQATGQGNNPTTPTTTPPDPLKPTDMPIIQEQQKKHSDSIDNGAESVKQRIESL